MSSQAQGLEARYLGRFSGLKPQTGTSLKNFDAAGNVATHLTNARASVKTQEKNIGSLFATAQELVEGINTTQAMLGRSFVKNMPKPTAEIKDSPSKQLGYVQLAMRFFQAGVMHFMEQMTEADQRIEHLEKLLERLAEYDEESDLLGEMVSLDLDSLESTYRGPPIAAHAEKPASPPPTPTKIVPVVNAKSSARTNGKK